MRRGDGGRSERRRFALVAVVLSILAATTSTRAQATGTTGAGTAKHAKQLVSVKIAGHAASLAPVLEVLRERIGSIPDVEPSFEVVPAIDPANIVTPGQTDERQLARIWIDLTEHAGRANKRDPVTLYVVDGPWERVLSRSVARQANPEVTWEEIGHIVELTLSALRAGESIGVGRAVARAALLPIAPAPVASPAAELPQRMETPPRTERRRWRFRGGAFYSTMLYGSQFEVASGPGGVLELHTRAGGRFDVGATLTGEYRLPSTVDRSSANVRFEGGAFHAMASGVYAINQRHQLLLAVGGGIELIHAKGLSPKLSNVHFANGSLDPIPEVRILARYGWVTSALRLFGGVGVDVPLRPPRYLLSREPDPIIVFEPWLAHPFILAGIETN